MFKVGDRVLTKNKWNEHFNGLFATIIRDDLLHVYTGKRGYEVRYDEHEKLKRIAKAENRLQYFTTTFFDNELILISAVENPVDAAASLPEPPPPPKKWNAWFRFWFTDLELARKGETK